MTVNSVESGQVPGQKSARMQALPQIIAVNIKNIILFAFGATVGFPTLLIPGVSNPKETFHFDDEGLSWIGSIVMICVPIGCIVSGTMSQAFGRRRSMQVVNVPFISAWLLFAFSTREWHIYLALTIFGLTGGSLEAPILTYVVEVTQPHIRGVLASISTASFFIGIMASFVLGMLVYWRTVAFICISFHLVCFIALFFIPESPHWLIQKGRFDEAKASLAWLRGWVTPDVVDEEYQQIFSEVTKNERENPQGQGGKCHEMSKTVKLFFTKSFIWPYLMVSFIFMLSHFCGMSPILAFAVPIFNTLKVPMDEFYATGLMGVVQLIGCIPNIMLIHVWGKRVLNFISLIVMGVCCTGIATYAYIENIYTLVLPLNNATVVEMVNVTNGTIHIPAEEARNTWIPFTLLIIFTLFAHVGIKVTPWVLVAEVFTTDLRAAATGICSATTYLMNFIVNKTFFSSVKTLTLPGVFWMYACVSFAGCGILYYILPETEGKTLIAIGEHFAGGEDIGTHVYKRSKIKENEKKLKAPTKEHREKHQIGLGVINNSYIGEARW